MENAVLTKIPVLKEISGFFYVLILYSSTWPHGNQKVFVPSHYWWFFVYFLSIEITLQYDVTVIKKFLCLLIIDDFLFISFNRK